MEMTPMSDRGKRVFLPLPDHFYDLTDDQQLCEHMGRAAPQTLYAAKLRYSPFVKGHSGYRVLASGTRRADASRRMSSSNCA